MKLNSREYVFPKKDFENLRNTIEGRIGKPLNLSLFFDKYILWKDINGKREAKLQNQQVFKKDSTGKSGFKGIVPNWAIPKTEYDNYFRRLNSLKETLRAQGYFCQDFSAKILWRLVVDLGAESVYETSINLHRNYSVPIIPGSAVKGCTKAHMLRENDGKESRLIKEIFGDSKQKGSVIFFDALPDKIPRDFLKLDVMNVHYPKYYQEGKTPGDWMEPNPIIFLAIENAEYQFSTASKNANLAKDASTALKEAIKEMGIGAKTSAGYGYFRTVS